MTSSWRPFNIPKGNLLVMIVVLVVLYDLSFPDVILPQRQALLRLANPKVTVAVVTQYNFTTLFQESEEDPWKRDLFSRLDKIRTVCGELCSINDRHTLDQKLIRPAPHPNFLGRLEVTYDCDAIVGASEIDAGDDSVPYPPPDELIPYYTLNGSIALHMAQRHTNVYLGGQAMENVWTRQMIEEGFETIQAGQFRGSYAVGVTMTVAEHLGQMDLKDKNVLVVGSETPWVETIALYHGAAQVTTLEYGAITSQHPQIRTLTPPEFRAAYQSNTLGQFDAAISFSSLEHPGLGRYGDALNPWADLLAVARIWCVTKPQGQLYLGLPTSSTWDDSVEFNAHRVYGKIRWPLITANWIQIPGISEKIMGVAGMGLLFQRVVPGDTSSLPVTTTKAEPQFCDYCPSGVAQFSCGDRVHYLVQKHGLSEADAKSTAISQAANTAEMCQASMILHPSKCSPKSPHSSKSASPIADPSGSPTLGPTIGTTHNDGAFECPMEPCHLNIVYMGDSLSRYMYISLVHFLRFNNTWIDQKDQPNMAVAQTYLAKNEMKAQWFNYYSQSMAQLAPYENCDCYRASPLKGDQVSENRYYYDPTRNNTITYIQAFGNLPNQGHWADPVQAAREPLRQMKLQKEDDQSTRNATAENDTGIPIVEPMPKLIKPLWRSDWASTIEDHIAKIRPEALVMNAGHWPHDFLKEKIQQEVLNATKTAGIPRVIWRTITAAKNGGGQADVTKAMCAIMECLDVGWTGGVSKTRYHDRLHFYEPVYRKMNEQFLDLIGRPLSKETLLPMENLTAPI